MYTKEEAKAKLAQLIATFEANPRKDSLTEQETREFVRSLFEILNWNFLSGDEVSQEEHISKGFVDYGFRLTGVPKLFVEAKKTANNLSEEKDINQAISYAWSKATTWAVLTNFKRVRIFNAYVKGQLMAAQLNDLEMKDYLGQFDVLWLLSKDSFESGLIDKEAEKLGKIAKRMPVEKQLFQDFNKWRELIAKDIKKNYSSKYDEEVLDEIIQTLLNRLILIRKIEDIGLEGRKLEEIYHIWNPGKGKKFSELLNDTFQYFDKEYDSLIFDQAKNELDNVVVSDNVIKDIIPELYRSSDGTVQYDFAYIPADILGNIYEQYLGYLLKASQKRATVTEKMSMRKEQGIYYTPTYIVDYIVKNTIGEQLKEYKTIQDIEKMKVLDPACGSGSFLIRAFDEIYNWYKQKGFDKTSFLADDKNSHKDFETVKDRIIKNNIFSVDLDHKAVEIARLNLLLKTVDKKHKLPQLQENIKVGNSLIDDPTITTHPFPWNIEFEKIMKNGGFDIVIGNPPYIRVDNLSEKEKPYFKEKYTSSQGKYDIYYLFIEKVFSWLKPDGVCGFIVPNKFCAASSAESLRETILTNSNFCTIISVSHLDVFKDAANYPVILILRKGKNVKKIKVGTVLNESELLGKGFTSYVITKENLNILPAKIIPINVTQKQFDLTIKLISKSDKLEKFLKISEGLRIPQNLESNSKEDFEILKQFQFEKWGEIKKDKGISKNNLLKVVSEKSDRYQSIMKNKIVVAEDALSITATIDEKKRVPQGGVYFGALKEENPKLKYLLGLLNSKLLSFIYNVLFGGMHMGGGYLRYRTEFLGQLPIRLAKKNQEEAIVTLVDKMLSLNKRLSEFEGKQTEEARRVQEEIKRTDTQIDELVYSLYGITEEEKRVIEEALNRK